MKITSSMLLLSAFLAVSAQAADPVLKTPLPVQQQPGQKATPQIMLKPDLRINSWGFTGEFCTGGCPELKQDFNLVELKCGFYAEVKNMGSGRSTPTEAEIFYTFSPWYNLLRGPTVHVKLRGTVPALNAGQAHRVEFRLPADRKQRYANVDVGVSLTMNQINQSMRLR